MEENMNKKTILFTIMTLAATQQTQTIPTIINAEAMGAALKQARNTMFKVTGGAIAGTGATLYGINEAIKLNKKPVPTFTQKCTKTVKDTVKSEKLVNTLIAGGAIAAVYQLYKWVQQHQMQAPVFPQPAAQRRPQPQAAAAPQQNNAPQHLSLAQFINSKKVANLTQLIKLSDELKAFHVTPAQILAERAQITLSEGNINFLLKNLA